MAVVRDRMPGGVGERREQSRLLPDPLKHKIGVFSILGEKAPKRVVWGLYFQG